MITDHKFVIRRRGGLSPATWTSRAAIDRLWPQIAKEVARAPGVRRRAKRSAIVAEMLKLDRSALTAMTDKQMGFAFKANRETCRKARNEALSETPGSN